MRLMFSRVFRRLLLGGHFGVDVEAFFIEPRFWHNSKSIFDLLKLLILVEIIHDSPR